MKYSFYKIALLIFLNLGFLLCYAQEATRESIVYGSNKTAGHYADLDGTKLYYESYGTGIPLLLLHGGLGSINDFEKNIPEFSKHFRVIAVDSRGYGRSNNPFDSLSYELLTNDMIHLIDTLKLDSVYVCGFSDGGIVALYMAAKYPEKVRKVVASGANYALISAPSEDFMGRDKVKTDTFWMPFRANYAASNPNPEKFDDHIQMIRKMWSSIFCIPKGDFVKINVPVLLLFGDRDLIPLKHGLEMFDLLPEKTTQLCILPHSNHFLFSQRSELVNGIVIDFLKNIDVH